MTGMITKLGFWERKCKFDPRKTERRTNMLWIMSLWSSTKLKNLNNCFIYGNYLVKIANQRTEAHILMRVHCFLLSSRKYWSWSNPSSVSSWLGKLRLSFLSVDFLLCNGRLNWCSWRLSSQTLKFYKIYVMQTPYGQLHLKCSYKITWLQFIFPKAYKCHLPAW